MAISDISLTSGMRKNLASLQNTVSLLNRTQQRLSTGKAVNSALDNPVNFFAAKALNDRATDLDSYKDQMSNAVQAINVANDSITTITSLISSAKALSSAAIGKPAASGHSTGTITLSGVATGDTITVDGTAYKADTDFNVGATDNITAMNLAAVIASGDKGLTALSVNGSTITIGVTDDDVEAADIVISSASFTSEIVPANNERSQLASQYATIISKLNDVVSDATYQGINLLSGGAGMTVNFGNSHNLTIAAATVNAAGLSLSVTATGSWATDGNVNTDITKLDNATPLLRIAATNLSNNLSIINARQDWTSSIINDLQTGADNLTMADTNQEGANMLMLQTRQSLGTTALSLSSQAAQSVLRLFS